VPLSHFLFQFSNFNSIKKQPLSSYKQKIDYAADFKIMKFGVVGIKIYLLSDGTPPYYYFFEFKNKL